MTGPSIRLRTGEGSRSSQRRLLSLFLGGALSLTKITHELYFWRIVLLNGVLKKQRKVPAEALMRAKRYQKEIKAMDA